MTLKEILNARKHASASSSAPAETESVSTNGTQVAELPNYAFATPLTEFQALFADCEDF